MFPGSPKAQNRHLWPPEYPRQDRGPATRQQRGQQQQPQTAAGYDETGGRILLVKFTVGSLTCRPQSTQQLSGSALEHSYHGPETTCPGAAGSPRLWKPHTIGTLVPGERPSGQRPFTPTSWGLKAKGWVTHSPVAPTPSLECSAHPGLN